MGGQGGLKNVWAFPLEIGLIRAWVELLWCSPQRIQLQRRTTAEILYNPPYLTSYVQSKYTYKGHTKCKDQ